MYAGATHIRLSNIEKIYQLNDEIIWRNEWGGKIFFSHGTKHSKGVCILINPLVQEKIDYSFSDKSGRIVFITIVINSLMLSLCNIYASNNQVEQLEFLQELNNCLFYDNCRNSRALIG